MAKYNYKEGQQRIQQILNATDPIEEDDSMSKESGSTCINGHYCWISSVFVNVRDSSSLFQSKDALQLTKIMRSFTSEVIEILRGNESDNLVKELGVRNDCVYAVYSTPSKYDIEEVVDRVFYVNTYIKMLNTLLYRNKINHILSVGVGVASARELVVNAERKGNGKTNAVWIGGTVEDAFSLSNIGSRDDVYPIVISNKTYSNIGHDHKKLFNSNITSTGKFYTSNAVFDEFKDWIDRDMKVEIK